MDKQRQPYSFDGKGINGSDEYRSRLATLTNVGQLQGFGPFCERAVNNHARLVAALNQFIALWPVLPGQDRPKAHPDVLMAWNAARAAIAAVEED